MVSVRLLAPRPTRLLTPVKALRLLQSRLIAVLVSLNAAKLRRLLLRGGSLYGAFALLLGGFYRHPLELVEVTARVNFTIVRTVLAYVLRGCKPLYPEWTLGFEVVRAVVRLTLSGYGDRLLLPQNAQHVRWQSEWVGTALGFVSTRQLGTSVEPFQHMGLEHLWIRSRTPPVAKSGRVHRVVVLYYHGGGFAVMSPRWYIAFASEVQSRVAKLLHAQLGEHDDDAAIHVQVLLANYRKIPEHPYPLPCDDALSMYEYLLTHEKLSPSQIILGGDSAGGALVMSTLLRIRNHQPVNTPLAALLVCPFIDMESGGNEHEYPHCIIGDRLGIAIYANYLPKEGDVWSWGDASPAHCDLQGLPPVYIQAAELDYLLPNSKRLYEKAKADGATDWTMDVHKNLPHVFSTFPTLLLPSASQGLDALAGFAARHFASSIKKTQDGHVALTA
ncbi:hypothetical protein Poli38472_004451 [Pythium oligandrum]|uniref:Alpha/beta hydrolase fold-3 domain-containing protein n=1 Tax=Pythium oligandrum TaxID=41045 RepID=A0A8K1CBK7_PYTOL|nr:hypothetical protein Poli38472_004451 [Pythium oligandrum]|eukprot:TMW59382.1 hypothetical protein Poli38472_004451 [Pythium oligandrum]